MSNQKIVASYPNVVTSDPNQITIKDLKITGPLAGKKLEIQFDLKPIEDKKDKDKDQDQEKNKNKTSENKSADWGGLGLLFFLLFSLILMVGQTGGFSSQNYAETETPRSIHYRYQPALK
jgi:hypothetical protein